MNLRNIIENVAANLLGLRCRRGDLAIVVKGNEAGRILQCIELVGRRPRLLGRNLWLVDQQVRWGSVVGLAPIDVPYIPDNCLRPLRDTHGEDEVLRIAGKPVGEPVKPAAPVPQTVEG